MDCDKGHQPIEFESESCPVCHLMEEQAKLYEILGDLFNGLQCLVYDIAHRMQSKDDAVH